MTLSVSDLRANADAHLIDAGEAGPLVRISSDDRGSSGMAVIVVEYDPDSTPAFTARFTQMLGASEVAAADDLDTILHDALEAGNQYFSGNLQAC